MMPVQIRKIDSQADFKSFFEFPWKLYQNDPYWTPPLLSMRHDQLDKKKNPAWEYMEGDYFGAFRDGQLVGTIAAYINHRHNEFNHEHIGWFGAFEVYDDVEAATALLNTAADWVKAKGYETMRGPQTFTTHEETGLLVDGFTRPILLMPYNMPYYEKLVLGAGLHPVMDTYSFYLSRAEVNSSGLDERLGRITQSIMKRNKVTIRQIDRKNLKKEFELFKELYNAAWEKNWSFVPMTEKELDALVKSLGQFFDPDLAFFGYVDGEPVGFIMAIPDFNQVLLKAYAKPGTPELITLLKAAYYWKINPIMDWARVPLMGVKEAYRSKGVDAVLYYYVLEAMLKGRYQHSDSGWILSINQSMVSIAKNFGSKIYKTYRYYEKAL
ncbi:MAG: N-acetyltransferase [Chloroflexi bacterium]|nr:N-acetyltransferase [Chloroflexota bacterium]